MGSIKLEDVAKEKAKLYFKDNAQGGTVDTMASAMIDFLRTVLKPSKLAELEEVAPPAKQYQLCPKCIGQGIVSKPPYVAGDVNEWLSSESLYTCNVCNGDKIIPTP
jgi:hypothetical protein